MTRIESAVRFVELLPLENSYEVLSGLTLIFYAVWLSCATVTKALSSCNLQQQHLSTSKELCSQWLQRESCSSKKKKSKI